MKVWLTIFSLGALLILGACGNSADENTKDGEKQEAAEPKAKDSSSADQSSQGAENKDQNKTEQKDHNKEDSNQDPETNKPETNKPETNKPETGERQESEVATIQNPENVEAMVNQKNVLPSDYEPKDLVKPNVKFSFAEDIEKRYMRKEAAGALEQLFKAAKENGHDLFAVSGYRSYKRQEEILNNAIQKDGEKKAKDSVAIPGQSDHQTGLAMDISSPAEGYGLDQSFGDTPEGKWVAEHASQYGFIIRYPKGKEDVTGIIYEPWHLRYVGEKVAEEVAASGQTLEEFYGDKRKF
ncbi:D-alanyl-D-alanine carboxypeptidase family protein [Bacillus gobiensis]|uniref:M15 family metallopeptidase n=1 Tax=Bacillus gobiensis TaxID=1441095 RepID=UPI003D1CF160